MSVVEVVEFPASVPIAHARFWLQSDTAGERGLDGRESVVFSENRYWVGKVTLPHLAQAQAMQLLACCDDLRGRAGVLRLPVANCGTPVEAGTDAEFWASLGISDADVGAGSLPYSDGARFSDGAGHALPNQGGVVAQFGAESGASVLRVQGFVGRNLAIGAGFSIDDFYYRAAGNSDGRIRFNPPLRGPVAAGAVIEVTAPHIRVRLSDPQQMRIDVEYGQYGKPLTFGVEEAFDR